MFQEGSHSETKHHLGHAKELLFKKGLNKFGEPIEKTKHT